ncbi:M24 family metallopeptidase [Patescibacteria group bacterium]
MRTRITKLRKAMKAKKLAAFLVTKPENIRWLSGFTGLDHFPLLITPTKKYMFAHMAAIDQAKDQTQGFTIVNISKNTEKTISGVFKKVRGKRIGFEDSVPYAELANFKKLDKNNKRHYKATKFLLEELRMIKDRVEVRNIKKACQLLDEAFAYTKKILRVGITEKDIAWEMEKFMRDRGGGEVAFTFVIGFGSNSARGHHEPSNRKLKAGEIVFLDYGIKYQGYCSDMSRILFFGKPTEKFKEIYEIIRRAQGKAIKAVKPGMIARDIHKIAADEIAKSGKYKLVHSLGHGMGLEIHEIPFLSPKNKPMTKIKLEPGMVFTIEPGIYPRNTGGGRIEDDILVTKKGYRRLTKSPRDLKSMIVKVKK